ncbi:zinc dependent phospholipase C family protein [Gemmatimonas sp.]|uniref:zinc dependent phospholipase C family protein n=2 Tax=Gemmatimonas sp. TaxID=1962908 RepID=UPI0022BF567F|nr:zinc dependent phospholipase C family protein [Gemmatimonas sp.]MCA2983969.1 zinc dependent phospholipase C family protein [Gemmatimonas sp.]MCA2992437.1 zinc dependent phospholipase C family protein [Gemmatimonas sp.]MCA2996119.1 zinc dependent phospholipase C family protein [Gemmatimonas sp.]MCE2954844.1 zinc dependent phospholipase C family protein [Gemmatimonas sp.]MCZ8010640.1 zinc dependent phospholipase C family protein [Gemmatimonas sp.]
MSERPRARVPWAACLLLALLVLAATPTEAWAWTPGTHVFLGDALLRHLSLVPPHIGALLAAYPADFLYGSIAADTSIAKKYAEVGRHCHSWHVGMEIHEEADPPALRAFALGYLAHLAADVVAHNFFVPRQLAVTSSTSALGHSYWESRIDTHLGELWPRRARELLRLDHSPADQHLDRILSPTLFGTPTNRRIFRGMVYVTDTESWQRIFQLVSENSRWDLADADVGRYLARAFDYIVDLLNHWDRSEPFAFDPSGDKPLREAKRVRRQARREGGDMRAALEADRMFGMPVTPLRHALDLPAPLFSPRERPAAG